MKPIQSNDLNELSIPNASKMEVFWLFTSIDRIKNANSSKQIKHFFAS